MKSLNLIPKMRKKFKVNTTDSNHNLPIAPNILDRNFNSELADTKYVGDITYIHTAEGWLYLATVIDLFSRKVVACSRLQTLRFLIYKGLHNCGPTLCQGENGQAN